MKRRQLIALIGAVGGGAAVLTGTGAFSSVSAGRDVSVEVASDATAYLSTDDTGNANAEYITETTGGEFGINLTGGNTTSGGGSGVNTGAVTIIEDLFEVRNQGTQRVEVGVTPLSFVEASGGNTTLVVLVVPDSNFPTVEIPTGQKETYSMIVAATEDAATSTQLTDTITISGEAV